MYVTPCLSPILQGNCSKTFPQCQMVSVLQYNTTTKWGEPMFSRTLEAFDSGLILSVPTCCKQGLAVLSKFMQVDILNAQKNWILCCFAYQFVHGIWQHSRAPSLPLPNKPPLPFAPRLPLSALSPTAMWLPIHSSSSIGREHFLPSCIPLLLCLFLFTQQH